VSAVPACVLCAGEEGAVLVHRSAAWRVIRPVDAAFPACYRVVWNRHVAEFSDLGAAERVECMQAVATIEQVLRQALAPTKVNLASLGNAVPHLHWHVIARFEWDSHFPQAVWGSAQRSVQPAAQERLGVSLAELDTRVAAAVRAPYPVAPD
jgi:diadenosine tetraphosphate (Ap4A) HIT family hydrolase